MASIPSVAIEAKPNHPLRILSLDGGGVRGLSSLIILEHLMGNVAKHEQKLGIRTKDDITIPKPCDYFDLIGGTSTGGIIAILLGRLRLGVRECIMIYSSLAADIFKKDRAVKVGGVKIPTGSTRFSGAVLEQSIKKALVEHGYREEESMWDDSLFDAVDETIMSQNIWTMVAASLPPVTRRPDARKTSWFKRRKHSKSLPALHPLPGAAQPDLFDHTFLAGSVVPPTSDAAKVSIPQDSANGNSGSIYQSSDTSAPVIAVQKCRTWRIQSQDTVHRKKGSRGCRALVVASLKNALGTAALLSTYNPNVDTTIWQALRATSAAPTFFEEVTFGTPKMTYLDGGMGFNNPCTEIVQEAHDIWPGRAVGIVLSIGTGLQTIPSVRKGVTWLPCGLGADISLISALGSMATSTARVHNEMQRLFSGSNTRYYRFDVDTGMAAISLEEWMKEDEMTSLTEQYMHDPRQVKRAQHVGELIVKFSALPPHFDILPSQFRNGIDGQDVERGAFRLIDIDFNNGNDQPTLTDEIELAPPSKPGVAIDPDGSARKILPVTRDLDGVRDKATIVSCVSAEHVCLRMQLEGIPQGKYKVCWIVAASTSNTITNNSAAPEEDLIFSVGRPWHKATFSHRIMDVRVAADIVPVLLRPDCVRVRAGASLRAEKGWMEIQGTEDVEVGLDGVLGFVISKVYREEDSVSGWHFGGVRMTPVFDSRGEEELRRYESS